jgi:hypothetical protein
MQPGPKIFVHRSSLSRRHITAANWNGTSVAAKADLSSFAEHRRSQPDEMTSTDLPKLDSCRHASLA